MSRLTLLTVALGACSSSLSVLTTTPTDGTGLLNPDDTGQGLPGDDDDDDGVNDPPIADAGPDQTAAVTEEVVLAGGGEDPDGDALAYEWTFVETPSGSQVELLNETRADASFFPDRAGTYVVELAVDDGIAVSTDEARINVTAPNDGPVANAGLDQTVDVGDRVLLNGSSSYDPDADPLEHTWSFASKPPGSGASLDGADTAFPQFTADVAGTYLVELVVTDGASFSSPDQVRVIAAAPGSSDCISCETAASELQRRTSAGQAASGGLLALLPILTMAWQKRRRLPPQAEPASGRAAPEARNEPQVSARSSAVAPAVRVGTRPSRRSARHRPVSRSSANRVPSTSAAEQVTSAAAASTPGTYLAACAEKPVHPPPAQRSTSAHASPAAAESRLRTPPRPVLYARTTSPARSGLDATSGAVHSWSRSCSAAWVAREMSWRSSTAQSWMPQPSPRYGLAGEATLPGRGVHTESPMRQDSTCSPSSTAVSGMSCQAPAAQERLTASSCR